MVMKALPYYARMMLSTSQLPVIGAVVLLLLCVTALPTASSAPNQGHANLSTEAVTEVATKAPDVDGLAAQFSTFFAGLASKEAFKGAVLVSRGDTVLLRAGYGLADREWKIPNTPATKFRIASITKGFTAAAIMVLQDQGKLNVKDRVCQYIERCPEAWRPITIHELLTHTAGVPDYNNLSG